MSFIVAGDTGSEILITEGASITNIPFELTKTFGTVDTNFLWGFIPSALVDLPQADRDSLEEIWKAMFQEGADLLLDIHQLHAARELFRVPVYYQRKWVWYEFSKFLDLNAFPTDVIFKGKSAQNFVYNATTRSFDIKAINKTSQDKAYFCTRGPFKNTTAEAFWEVDIDFGIFSGGTGAIVVGAFDSRSNNLNNSASVAIADDRSLLAIVVDEEGVQKTIRFPDVFTVDERTYTVRCSYLGDEFRVAVGLAGATVFNVSIKIQAEIILDSYGISNLSIPSFTHPVSTFFKPLTNAFMDASISRFIYKDYSVYPEVVEVPYFQDTPENPPNIYRNGIDFTIQDGGINLFIEEDPDGLWAEFSFLNLEVVRDNFGWPVGLFQENSERYLNSVQGLWFVYLNGPTPENIESGIQINIGQPFVQVAGEVTRIDTTFPGNGIGTIVVEGIDYEYDTRLRHGYLPDSFTQFSVGDILPKFTPLTADAVTIRDYINDPDWYILESIRHSLATDITVTGEFPVGGGLGPYRTQFSPIIPGSVTVRDGAAVLVETVNYTVDYTNGDLTLLIATTNPPDMDYSYIELSHFYVPNIVIESEDIYLASMYSLNKEDSIVAVDVDAMTIRVDYQAANMHDDSNFTAGIVGSSIVFVEGPGAEPVLYTINSYTFIGGNIAELGLDESFAIGKEPVVGQTKLAVVTTPLTRYSDYGINYRSGEVKLSKRASAVEDDFVILLARHMILGMSEVQKYHTFNVRLGPLNLPWEDFARNVLVFTHLIRPTYARQVFTDIDGRPVLRYGGISEVIDFDSLVYGQQLDIPLTYGFESIGLDTELGIKV